MIYAVIFNADGTPFKFATGRPIDLNANLAVGQTWRVVDISVRAFADIPALSSLDPDPALIEPTVH